MSDSYSIALVVESAALSLSELSARFGREPQSGSHEKGAPRGLPGSGLTWKVSVWRENAPDANAPLQARCASLLHGIPPECLDLLASRPDDTSVRLDIAVFFKSAHLSLSLPRALIGEICAKGIDIEITGYPCSDEASA